MSDRDQIIQTTTERSAKMQPAVAFFAALWATLVIGMYWFAWIHDFWWEW